MNSLRLWQLNMALAIAIPGFILLMTWPRSFIGLFTDSLYYVRMATVLSPFAIPSAADLAAYQSAHFPPGYPWLLGLLGGTRDNLAWVACVHTAMLAAAIMVVSWFFQLEFGKRYWAWIPGSLLVTALSPSWIESGLRPCSEPLFVVLLLLGIILYQRGQSRAAALALGFSCLVRTIGIVSLPALAIVLIRKRTPLRGFAISMALAVLPYLVWQASLVGLQAMGNTRDEYTSDLAVLLRVINEHQVLPFLLQQGRALLSAFSLAVSTNTPQSSIIAGGAIALCTLPGWLQRLRVGKLDAHILPFYLGLLAVWPYPIYMPRFLMPIIPLLLVNICGSLEYLVRGRKFVMLLLGFWALLHAKDVILRMGYPVDKEQAPYKVDGAYYAATSQGRALAALEMLMQLDAAFKKVSEVVPEGSCVYGTLPELSEFIANRPFVLPKPGLNTPVSNWDDFPVCDFFLITSFVPNQAYNQKYYPFNAISTRVQQVFYTALAAADGRNKLIAALLIKTSAINDPR